MNQVASDIYGLLSIVVHSITYMLTLVLVVAIFAPSLYCKEDK